MKPFRFGSICSGIEAASVAWDPLGWKPSFLSDIEAFPRAVLAHHYPDVPLHGDFTTIRGDEYDAIDLLVGGTPCQSFSIAGLRGGMDDERGNLALEYLRLADRTRPSWLAWENVPGVLSSNGGRDFGAILGGMGELGYGVAYRILDAQFFGVPQRRRRVFVVGYLGDWRPAAAVLFERHSLQGHPPPRRKTGKSSAIGTLGGTSPGGGWRIGPDEAAAGHLIASTGEISHCLNAGGMGRQDYETETLIAHSLRGEGFDASEDGTGRGTPLVPVAFPILEAGARTGVSTTDPRAGIGIGSDGDPMFTLQAGKQHGIGIASAVRRLTPRECERLQGFPDDYTAVPFRGKAAADGPRYKALGNSMAVPVMRWIGERIAAVDMMLSERRLCESRE